MPATFSRRFSLTKRDVEMLESIATARYIMALNEQRCRQPQRDIREDYRNLKVLELPKNVQMADVLRSVCVAVCLSFPAKRQNNS